MPDPLPAGSTPLGINQPPYPTVLKPYGQSLVDLAKERDEVVCFTGDLTRQVRD